MEFADERGAIGFSVLRYVVTFVITRSNWVGGQTGRTLASIICRLGRETVSDTNAQSAGVAARYATALFDLAKEAKKLPAVEKDLDALADALDASDDLSAMISSPVHTRDELQAAITAVAKKMKLSPLVTNTLGVMGAKGRLFVLPGLITSVKHMIADEKGEITAEVTSAKKLTATQSKNLAATLKKTVGKDVVINATVDETLIGGLIVKVGSKMIDSSIRSKLSNLQNAMKEVG